jgi:hypothetical protein
LLYDLRRTNQRGFFARDRAKVFSRCSASRALW